MASGVAGALARIVKRKNIWTRDRIGDVAQCWKNKQINMYHNETKCFREKNRKRSQNSHSIALFSLKNMSFLITSRALWTTSGMKRTIGGDRGLQKDMKVRSHQTMWGLGPHLVTKGSCKPRRSGAVGFTAPASTQGARFYWVCLGTHLVSLRHARGLGRLTTCTIKKKKSTGLASF